MKRLITEATSTIKGLARRLCPLDRRGPRQIKL